jgi:hypothetical protein
MAALASLKMNYGVGRRGRQIYNRLYANSPAQRAAMAHSEDLRRTAKYPLLYNLTAATGIAAFDTAAGPAYAQGSTHQMVTGGGLYFDIFASTAQTIMPILTPATGLEIGLDKVNNETVEYVPGGNSAANPFAYIVGTSQPTLLRVALNFVDSSGSDQFIVGFRKQETFQVPTSFLTTGDALYTDFLGIGFAATAAAANPVQVAYDVANGGSTFVNAAGFTWADTKTHILEVRLIGSRARMLINGAPLGASISQDGVGGSITAQSTSSAGTTAFNAVDADADGVKGFDAALTLIPFIFSRYDATTPGAIYLQGIEIGPLSEFGLDSGNESIPNL